MKYEHLIHCIYKIFDFHFPLFTIYCSRLTSTLNQALVKLQVGKQFTRAHVGVRDFTHKC